MSALYDEVLKIAKEMETEGDKLEVDQALHDAALYHRISRRLLKALAECGRASSIVSYPDGTIPIPTIKVDNIQSERAKKLSKAEESLGASMTTLVGGEDDGVMVPLDPKMPVGAKTLVSGKVYQLSSERRLVFNQEETERINKKS